jgi:enoyl-CoA hydratase/3-hydroxyacyl-CoA dehydrogenase
MARIRSNLTSRVKKGRMSQAAADAAMAKVTGTLDYNSFGESLR